jgi:hypothetical protein
MFDLKKYNFAQENNQAILETMNRDIPRENNSNKDYEVCSEMYSIKVGYLPNSIMVSIFNKKLNKVLDIVHTDNPKEVISKYITLAFGTI